MGSEMCIRDRSTGKKKNRTPSWNYACGEKNRRSYCTTNLRGIRRRTRCRRHRQGREWQRMSVRASQRYRRVGRDTLWVTQSIVRGQCLLLQFVQMVLKVCCAARDARHRSSRRRRRHLPTWLRWNGGQWPTCGTLHMRCRVACRLLPCHDRRTLVLDRLQRYGLSLIHI